MDNNGLMIRSRTEANSVMWKRGKLCFTIILFQTIVSIFLTLFSVYDETAESSNRLNSVSPAFGGLDPQNNPIQRYLPHLQDHMVLSLIGLGLSSTSSSTTMLSSLGFNLLTFTFASSWALLWPHLITPIWEDSPSKLQSSTSGSSSSSISFSTFSFLFSSSPAPATSPVSSTSPSLSSPSSIDGSMDNSSSSSLSSILSSPYKHKAPLSQTYFPKSHSSLPFDSNSSMKPSKARRSIQITLGINSILRSAHYGLGVTLSLGSLQGKVSPLQCLILAVFEVPIISLIDYILSLWQVADESGGLVIYVFSVYFGLGVSAIICRFTQATRRKTQHYDSDRELSILLGTIFTYLTFPTVTSSYSLGDKKHRFAVNSWISVTASCLSAFAVSSLLDSNDRFSVRHIRIGSAAGGVVVSIVGHYMLYPYTVFVSGMFIGGLSIAAHIYINPYLLHRLRIHDTLSMHAAYGIPAFISGLASSGFAYLADENSFGLALYELLPARAPPKNSKDLEEIQVILHRVNPGLGRSARSQALYQLFGLFFIWATAVITGLLTGLLLVQPVFDPPERIEFFQDNIYWVLSGEGEDDFTHGSLCETETNPEDVPLSDLLGRNISRKISRCSASLNL
ncbi:ammonium transporter Rh type B-like [Tetranychus urticae]|uniref:Ammonium transporter AmtB-like domain-containing protein n=1 Tax=Tetranychus urticae TaxID=32264 RepID=T1K3Q7_TETUR|nr:ammonium transporter Rh type B-like [Tetranychus urticae]